MIEKRWRIFNLFFNSIASFFYSIKSFSIFFSFKKCPIPNWLKMLFHKLIIIIYSQIEENEFIRSIQTSLIMYCMVYAIKEASCNGTRQFQLLRNGVVPIGSVLKKNLNWMEILSACNQFFHRKLIEHTVKWTFEIFFYTSTFSFTRKIKENVYGSSNLLLYIKSEYILISNSFL